MEKREIEGFVVYTLTTQYQIYDGFTGKKLAKVLRLANEKHNEWRLHQELTKLIGKVRA